MKRHIIASGLALSLLTGACGISEEVYKRDVDAWKTKADTCETDLGAARGEREQVEAERRRLEAELAQKEAAHNRCMADLTAAGEKSGEIAGSLKEALAELEQQRARSEQQRKMLEGLVSSLDAMISAGKVKVVRRNGRLVVQIAENILFDSGKSRLKAEGKAALAELAPLLASVGREFQVTGHTDNVGSATLNWRLSVDRAFSVLEELLAGGYPSERLSAAGYAWFQPVASNDDADGRQQNRRVDIVLVPNLDELKLPSVSAR